MKVCTAVNELPREAARLIQDLGLTPHPEGGWYRRLHTGTVAVRRPDGEQRPGVTLIHYLLPAGAFSAWHRVDGDEIWHYLDGDALELLHLDQQGRCQPTRLGPMSQASPVTVIPAGDWQAARPLGQWTLAACAVGPGFAFHGFELLRERDDAEGWLAGHEQDLRELL